MNELHSSAIVSLVPDRLPQVRRLSIGNVYLTLKNRKDVKKIPLQWDFEEQKQLLPFLGYWFEKGYYDDQSVVLACGKDLPGLIQIFDYVAELFKCNYRIKKYQVVYFDSAILKYSMIGLGFPNIRHGERLYPGWITNLPVHLLKEYLRGLLTGCSKICDDKIVCETTACNLLYDALPKHFSTSVTDWKIPSIKCNIPASSFASFREYVGFLSPDKNSKLERILFYNTL